MTVFELLTSGLSANGARGREGEKDGSGRIPACCSVLTTFDKLGAFSLSMAILCLLVGGCSCTGPGRVVCSCSYGDLIANLARPMCPCEAPRTAAKDLGLPWEFKDGPLCRV